MVMPENYDNEISSSFIQRVSPPTWSKGTVKSTTDSLMAVWVMSATARSAEPLMTEPIIPDHSPVFSSRAPYLPSSWRLT